MRRTARLTELSQLVLRVLPGEHTAVAFRRLFGHVAPVSEVVVGALRVVMSNIRLPTLEASVPELWAPCIEVIAMRLE